MQRLQAAVQAYQGKDLDGAEAISKQILEVNPKEPNSLHLLGCLYKERGQLQQAVDLIQASIREDDSNPIPFLNLGKILAIAGQHENAVGVFEESLKRNEQIPETWLCFGNALREIEKTQEAIEAYRNTLQLNPAHGGAASNLGALLTDEDALEEAEEVLLKAIELNPQVANSRINYGRVLAKRGDHVSAIKQYQYALTLAPESPELLYNHANSLKDEGEVEEAIESYRKAIKVKPDFADAYFGLGIVLKEEGELEEAIESYRKAIELKPDFKDAKKALLRFQGEYGVREQVTVEGYREYLESNDEAGILIAAYSSFESIPPTRRSVNSWVEDRNESYFGGEMFGSVFVDLPWVRSANFAESSSMMISKAGNQYLDAFDIYRSSIKTLQVRMSLAPVISSLLESISRKKGGLIDVIDVGGWSGNALFLAGFNDSWEAVKTWSVVDTSAVCEPCRHQLPGLLESLPDRSGGKSNLAKLSFEELDSFYADMDKTADLIYSCCAQHYNPRFNEDLDNLLSRNASTVFLQQLPFLVSSKPELGVCEIVEHGAMVYFLCSQKFLSEMAALLAEKYGYSFKMWSEYVEPKLVFWQPQEDDKVLPKKVKEDAKPLLMKSCCLRFDKLD